MTLPVGALRLRVPSLDDIRSARELIEDSVSPSPLLRLDGVHPSADVYLKLECLQPIGSFKLRGALNALRQHDGARMMEGVVTASAGNMAQGLAWAGRKAGVRTTVVMPDSAPRTKVQAVERLGGRIVGVPFDRWWEALRNCSYPGLGGLFIHPVAEQFMIEGNGTVGLEIAESLDRVDSVMVPFGGGGLVTGIAAALADGHPNASVYACEVETAAPLSASLAADRPMAIQRRPSFVDGIGGSEVLEEMWPLVRQSVNGARVVSLSSVVRAVRLLVERQSVVAEGAGATPVAAALGDPTLEGVVVCVVSGGNIDAEPLAAILQGEMP